jgi:hypothetical protein
MCEASDRQAEPTRAVRREPNVAGGSSVAGVDAPRGIEPHPRVALHREAGEIAVAAGLARGAAGRAELRGDVAPEPLVAMLRVDLGVLPAARAAGGVSGLIADRFVVAERIGSLTRSPPKGITSTSTAARLREPPVEPK